MTYVGVVAGSAGVASSHILIISRIVGSSIKVSNDITSIEIKILINKNINKPKLYL